MTSPAKVLVVDDTPHNVKLLADLLGVKGYAVTTAASGEEALAKVAAEPPDLVLLDIMMPGLSGYDVCRRLRADPQTALLPVVLVTSLDPQGERIKGIEAGADDFLPKPINQAELFARVRSLLRIKALQDEVRQQAQTLRDWNATLEQRVAEQVRELKGLSQLKRFFAPAVADAIVSAGEKSILAPLMRPKRGRLQPSGERCSRCCLTHGAALFSIFGEPLCFGHVAAAHFVRCCAGGGAGRPALCR